MDESEKAKRLTQLARRMGGENASRLISVLAKNKEFVNAIETPVGQELVKDIVMCVENIMGVIMNEKDSDKDRADLRAYLNILNRWQGRIAQYNADYEKFKAKSS